MHPESATSVPRQVSAPAPVAGPEHSDPPPPRQAKQSTGEDPSRDWNLWLKLVTAIISFLSVLGRIYGFIIHRRDDHDE